MSDFSETNSQILSAKTVLRHPCYASELRLKECKIPEAWEVFCAPQTPSLSGLGPSPAAQRFEAAKSKRLAVSNVHPAELFFAYLWPTSAAPTLRSLCSNSLCSYQIREATWHL